MDQMPLQTPTLEKDKVSTEIDLKSLLGDSAKDESVREVFLQAALDKMSERLDQGRGVDGKLDGYSTAYKNSVQFQIFGKTKTVNMQLTGDMLAAVSELESKNKSNMTIGIDDKLEAAKAFGHITGFEGHPTLEGKVAPRKWFGWKDSEIKSIAAAIRPEINKSSIVSDAAILKILNKLIG